MNLETKNVRSWDLVGFPWKNKFKYCPKKNMKFHLTDEYVARSLTIHDQFHSIIAISLFIKCTLNSLVEEN